MTTRDLFRFENTFFSELEGMYAPWKGAKLPAPTIVKVNRDLAEELGLNANQLDGAEGAAILSGSQTPPGASPLAQIYAGHQFGGFSPQLGDGRALLLGELVDANGVRRDLHLKGSGPTPFSRGGDGKAAIGPVLREYLVGEFMHAVGIPTTRSLAATLTGESVFRESSQPGAVLARVASSHIRVGSFQYFAHSGAKGNLQRLADYTIQRHYPELRSEPSPYLGLLRSVVERQAGLIAKWMAVGFVHGVMNTDNMTIAGETIDYGPCAFIDGYQPNSVFSSIDHGGRYAYSNQPVAAKWNLARFAETLLDLIDSTNVERAIELATEVVEGFPEAYERSWLREMCAKLGLERIQPGDRQLVQEFLVLLESVDADFTAAFRSLSSAIEGDEVQLRELVANAEQLDGWLAQWRLRHEAEGADPQLTSRRMDRINPLYIPRNHKVEQALEAATALDFAPFEKLAQVLDEPFVERSEAEDFANRAPAEFGPYTTYCGT